MTLLKFLYSQEKWFKKGVQQYKCYACGKRFIGGEGLNTMYLWNLNVRGKQTYKESATSFVVSESTIRRKIKSVAVSYF